MKKSKHIFLKIVICSFVLILIAFVLYIFLGIDRDIDISLVKQNGSSVTKIYYFDYEDRENRIGEAIELTDEALFLERYEWKSIDNMPNNLVNAFIAVEDKRFWQHSGVDWKRTLKAVGNYLFKFDGSSFGGSTITQQLVKNLTGENEYTAKRKLEEIVRAISLENKLSKREILELYLNVVYLAENCYGVNAASNLYFNKNVEELTITECASLASIIKSPNKYDPYLHPDNNTSRRNIVLKQMLLENYITNEEYEAAINEELKLSDDIDKKKSSGIYSWYTETLINDVAEQISKEYDLNLEASRMIILKGGLNIYSTIDPKIQDELTNIYEKYPSYVLPVEGKYPQSSCIVIDPKTSDVLALVGGTGKKSANMILNRATMTKRPPGSVIKPLSVYAPLIEENKIKASTVFDDTPITLKNNETWPKNSPNKYRGLVSTDFAIERSINTVAVKALELLGPAMSYDYLTTRFKLTLDNENDVAPSPLALGQLTQGETLMNMTNAYSALANGGYISNPKTFLYVTDNYGNIILNNEDNCERILSEETSDIMTKMLENVVNYGTARGIKVKEKVAIAGKTGTSSEMKDRWFIGYSPDYLCGVWTGFDMPEPIYSYDNPSVTIFDELFSKIYKEVDNRKEFLVSDKIVKVEYCMDSGLLPGKECREDLRGDRIRTGYFIAGEEPKEYCDLHKRVYIDMQDGKIANSYTPFLYKRPISLIDYHRVASFEGVNILDSEYFIENRRK